MSAIWAHKRLIGGCGWLTLRRPFGRLLTYGCTNPAVCPLDVRGLPEKRA